jgi:hypothetical protein
MTKSANSNGQIAFVLVFYFADFVAVFGSCAVMCRTETIDQEESLVESIGRDVDDPCED